MNKIVQVGQLKQTLKMTASMQQNINMLQMSSQELYQFASQELSKNPFLEEDIEDSLAKSKFENSPTYAAGGASKNGTNFSDDIFSNITNNKTLKDHIQEQINISVNEPIHKLIAHRLLDHLQSNGYIEFDEQELAQDLKCSVQKIISVLEQLQNFEPAGIFARNLKECLRLQLKEIGKLSSEMQIMIQNLDLVSKGEFKKLAKICGVELDNLKQMLMLLKTLNPKPGNGFLMEATTYKLPDILLYLDANIAKLEINPEAMPRLQLNHQYFLQIKNNIQKKEDKIFINNEMNVASNIVKAIDMRAKTILRVASCIVDEQMDFFTRGIMYFKPLTLNKIAELTNLNESTVSRATANKYISTPNGIFELKYFFSSGLASTKDISDNVSSTKVKELIRQIIEAEKPDNILADQDIALELKKFNIKIARRTVAKYREEAGIPTSALRKRQQIAKF